MNHLPRLLTMLDALISTPSVSSTIPELDEGNRDVIHLLAEWLGDLGFRTELMLMPDQPQKANLIATLGEGPGGLVLAGHTDTVPYDEKRWQVDPLALTEKDNRLYGLGSTDMKGFFPVAIEAVRPYLDAELTQPLIILATADEESSMCGAHALVAAGKPKARYAVIGEPTALRPIHKHKSIMMQAVTFIGRSGHSSDPALGNNAMEAMHEFIGLLLAYRAKIQREHRDPAFKVMFPTLNLGCIHGGDNPNRICGECEIHFDARLLPGMRNAEVRAEITAIGRGVAERRGCEIAMRDLFTGVEPFAQADSELIRVAEKLTGHRAEAVSFATEAPFMQQLGIETMVFGPGRIEQAHQPDEYLAMDAIEPCIDVIRGLIDRFCL